VTLLVVLGLVALYPLGLYFYVDHSIDRVDALATDGPEVLAPQLQAGLQNYLVVGSSVPGEKGAASIALLLASVSADGRRAVLLTVPPTALVDTPECRTAGGRLREPRTESLAGALLDGSPSCAVRAVQEVSGLRIDHYLDLDLSRLPGMVDALGGVPVCGSRFSGSEAAAYLRPAGSGADATGTGTASRTQLLLTATLRAAMSRSTLTSPVALTRFLTRSAGALTVDDGTTLGDLRGLGSALHGLPDGAVQHAELPLAQVGYTPAGSKQSYALLDGDATRALFDSVIDRTRLPAGYGTGGLPAKDGGASGAGAAAPSPAPTSAPAPAAGSGVTVPPAQVTVDVLNGTSRTGLAATAATALKQVGFAVGTVGNAPSPVAKTVVRYGSGAEAKARTVAAAVPGSVLQADPAAGAGVRLVIGPGWSTAVPVHMAAPTTVTPSAPAPTSSPAAKAVQAAPCG
jgi:hypothetical protein